jgi:DHA3 family macrolide efflux protein-like MFS transporter
METPLQPLGFRQTLAIAPFRRLWLAALVSVLGDFLAIFAVFAVATFRMHATAAEISFLLVAFMLPFGVISPVAGVMVDRWNLKVTMISSDLVRAAIAGCLLFADQLWQIYVIFVALATVSSFFIPAQSVMLRKMVPTHGLMSANALMSQAMQVTQILTPAAAGWLVASAGPEVCFWFDVASFLFSAGAIASIKVSGRHEVEGRTIESFWTDLTSGMRFIFTHAAVSFVMVSGMICATQFVNRLGARKSKDRIVVLGLMVAAVFILLVAAFPATATTAVGMFGMGFGMAFVFIPSQTLLQQHTPPGMLGRVSSSMMSSLGLAQAIGLGLSGSVAQAVGIRPLYFACAALLGVVAVMGHRKLAGQAAAASS